jgi:hypothetical protein
MQIHADADAGQTSQKVEFYIKNILYVGNMSQKIYLCTSTQVQKFWKGWKSGLLVRVQIRIQESKINEDPCESGNTD